jgi:endo-1,4-beta-xylanase
MSDDRLSRCPDVVLDVAGRPVTRRAALTGLSCLALGATLAPDPSIAAPLSDLELQPSLRSLARSSGIKVGCAASPPAVVNDAVLLERLADEADIFVPEAHLKWEFTEPSPNRFDFSGPDGIADFASRHDMIMHGHTLVWYATLPPWVLQLTTASEARRAMERHIETLVSRYQGRIWAWDVVNEPIEPLDHIENGYRNSIWQRLLGIEHVDLAFRLARNADARTPLCLNEYGFEYTTSVSRRRRQGILALLRRLRDLNVPVDCFGLQSHLEAHQIFDRVALTDFLRSVAELGYRFLITELDVNDVEIRGSEAERDAAVAQHADEYLDIVFSVARPMSLSTWGLSDRTTWMRQYYKRRDGTPLRPLPLDRNLERKKLWATLARYLSATGAAKPD